MTKDKQNLLQMLAVPIGIGVGAIIVGLLWPSFYWLMVGCIILLFSLFYLIYGLIVKDTDEMSFVPGCYGFVLLALVSVLNIIFNGTRYISSEGQKQHLYSDCQYIKNSKNVKEVSRLEGFFHLVFSDCKKCEQRETVEEKQRRTNKKIEQLQKLVNALQEDIEDSQKKIKILKEDIEALQNGADVDTYHFRNIFDDEEVEEDVPDEDYADSPFLRYEP